MSPDDADVVSEREAARLLGQHPMTDVEGYTHGEVPPMRFFSRAALEAWQARRAASTAQLGHRQRIEQQRTAAVSERLADQEMRRQAAEPGAIGDARRWVAQARSGQPPAPDEDA